MSHKYKPYTSNGAQPALVEPVQIDVQPSERQKVEQLIAAGKSGLAVDFAKDVHKRRHNVSSEELLVDAYGARIRELLGRNLDRDANAVMELVRERYPLSAGRLREWRAIAAARRGDLGALLEPLTDPGLPPEKQAVIALQVKRDVRDLRALATCETLSAEHPLRHAALALAVAFEAVTSGPVGEEALALPEVSRQSPLAPWKMMIRAIAAFYRRDDALCEKYLATVEPDSAAARLAPPLRAMMHQAQSLTPAATALVDRAGGNLDRLRATLKKLDAAIERRSHAQILEEIRDAVAACKQAEPALLERLKQHISVRAMLATTKADKVVVAMDGGSLKNAYFWRLLARAFEETLGNPMMVCQACSAWEEFRKHAIREGWFAANGPEAATLYLHMADLLRHLSDDEENRVLIAYERRFDGHVHFYRGQPAEIRSVMPDPNQRHLYFLYTSEVLERACEADPCAENFERWLRYAQAQAPATADRVAERWSAALPHDIAPLLHLMESAEKRDAFQKAFKFMERAEQIDGLNAAVRRARLRLLVAMAVKHLKAKKPALAAKELDQMRALPQAQQGDRPAFLAALRWVWCVLGGANEEAQQAYQETLRILDEPTTGHVLVVNVEHWCGLGRSPLPKPPRPTVPLFAAVGRVCALADDMGMTLELVERVPEQIMKELSKPNVSGDPRALAALGEAAIRHEDFPLAYTIAGVGLAQSTDTHGRFLFLRARSMPPWEAKRQSACLAAATELARRHHDSDLLDCIAGYREDLLEWSELPEAAASRIDTDEISRVVNSELAARQFPWSAPPGLPADYDDGECQCPDCRMERGEMPELPPQFLELLEQMGPDAVAAAMAEMLGFGKKKGKRRRRHSELSDDDLPF